jgi:hypothetical protein
MLLQLKIEIYLEDLSGAAGQVLTLKRPAENRLVNQTLPMRKRFQKSRNQAEDFFRQAEKNYIAP